MLAVHTAPHFSRGRSWDIRRKRSGDAISNGHAKGGRPESLEAALIVSVGGISGMSIYFPELLYSF